MSPASSPSYFLSAGEVSGDLLGAELALAMSRELPDWSGFGITGEAMASAGVRGIASISELSVMGVSEVLAKVGSLRMLESQVLAAIDRMNPRFALLIDNPGFHLRLAEQLRMRGIPVFQYVAPKLWAWGAGRASKLRRVYDQIFGILPFEEDFFKAREVPYTYVGCPLKDRIEKVVISREDLGIASKTPIIACLPGSRMSELALNLPTLVAVRRHAMRSLPDGIFVVPLASHLNFADVARIMGLSAESPGTRYGGLASCEAMEMDGFLFVRGMSLEIMAVADAALVASGTATLECALLGTPLIVVYSMSSLSYQIARRVVNLPYVSLVNLMARERVVSEYIQDFSTMDIAEELLTLTQDTVKRRSMVAAFAKMRDDLKGGAARQTVHWLAERFGESRVSGMGA